MSKKGKKNVKEQIEVAHKFQSSHVSQSSQSKMRTQDRSKLTKPDKKKKDKPDEKKKDKDVTFSFSFKQVVIGK